MKKWYADEIGVGTEHQYGVEVYVASEVDAIMKHIKAMLWKAIEEPETFDRNQARQDMIKIEGGTFKAGDK
jgi:hypothetical protein